MTYLKVGIHVRNCYCRIISFFLVKQKRESRNALRIYLLRCITRKFLLLINFQWLKRRIVIKPIMYFYYISKTNRYCTDIPDLKKKFSYKLQVCIDLGKLSMKGCLKTFWTWKLFKEDNLDNFEKKMFSSLLLAKYVFQQIFSYDIIDVS